MRGDTAVVRSTSIDERRGAEESGSSGEDCDEADDDVAAMATMGLEKVGVGGSALARLGAAQRKKRRER